MSRLTAAQQAQDERAYWQSVGEPLGWKPTGWNLRSSCLFMNDEERTLEVTSDHVDLIRAHVLKALEVMGRG